MDLCKYKDIFGKPGEGAHSIRIFNIAIVDVILTFVSAFVLKLIMPGFSYWSITVFLFLLGIILHHMFCVKTTIDKLIFGN